MTVQPFFASGAAEDQIPSANPQFAAGDAILDAAFVFATSSFSQTSTGNVSRSGTGNFTSPATNISPVSTLSLVAHKIARPQSQFVGSLRQIESPSGLDMKPSSTNTALLRHLRSSVAAYITPMGGFNSGCTVPFFSDQVSHTSTRKGNSEENMPLPQPTSQNTSRQSRHASHTFHTSRSKTDDERTTTYTSTVTRLITITVPATGDADTKSY